MPSIILFWVQLLSCAAHIRTEYLRYEGSALPKTVLSCGIILIAPRKYWLAKMLALRDYTDAHALYQGLLVGRRHRLPQYGSVMCAEIVLYVRHAAPQRHLNFVSFPVPPI